MSDLGFNDLASYDYWSRRVTRPHDDAWSLTSYTDRAGRTYLRVMPTATADETGYDQLIRERTHQTCAVSLRRIEEQSHDQTPAPAWSDYAPDHDVHRWGAESCVLHPVSQSHISMHGRHILTRRRDTTHAELQLERLREDSSLWST